jgi:transcription antitermination factor NusG
MLTFAFPMIAENKKENITCWYLLYTNPRAEKKVAEELQKKGYEVFLALQRTLKVWSDRKKWVEEPLFKSYLFIHTELERNYYDILNVHGVVKFVSFNSKPIVVNGKEIELVKLMLGVIKEIEIINKNNLILGIEVEIISGPLIGEKGKLIQKSGINKVRIELPTIQQNLIITISMDCLKIIN